MNIALTTLLRASWMLGLLKPTCGRPALSSMEGLAPLLPSALSALPQDVYPPRLRLGPAPPSPESCATDRPLVFADIPACPSTGVVMMFLK